MPTAPPLLSARTPGWRSAIADLLRTAPARAGQCRVVAVEGRSGAGKTALAEALSARLRCPVVHMDDLYPGWDGLAPSGPRLAAEVLAPLADGAAPSWRRWDWAAGGWAPDDPGGWHSTAPADTLIVEGCGSGHPAAAAYLSLLVWVDAPAGVRAERLDARWDAGLYRPHRSAWAAQEDAFYRTAAPQDRAHAILDNSQPAA
ncbi:nucleoside/nucleotide kinase family protein [Nocardiopsis coralliicola]